MNEGKLFEQDFRKSIPDDVYSLRLADPAIGFNIESSRQRFAPKNPYDMILYKEPRMYCLELKSTKEKSIRFAGDSPMIREHQIKKLTEAAQKGCIAGFVLNFRSIGHTYFLEIDKFHQLIKGIDRHTIRESEIRDSGILIPERKLRSHNRYDLNVLFGIEQISLNLQV